MTEPDAPARPRRDGAPTGLPADPLAAARALADRLAQQTNLPTQAHDMLYAPSRRDQVAPAAQLAAALALTDIAVSLRVLSGRTDQDTRP